jgi:hypothetical protein
MKKMNLLELFKKANKEWPKNSIKVPYGELSKIENFELGYFAASDIPFQCFSIKLNPADDHLKDVALLYSSASKQFISLLNSEDGFALTLFERDTESLDSHLKEIKLNLMKYRKQFKGKIPAKQDQIAKCILVERKVDEVLHFSLTNELGRRVYFAIGECRERAALIPIFQKSKGADLVQLALHKWMDFASKLDQDQPFPKENTKGIVKNFIQIKKWLNDIIKKQLAGISTIEEENTVE